MDDRQFDVWTRRRFGLVTGGVATALFGVALSDKTAAKKKGKKRRKRCVKLLQACHTGGRTCCHHNACVSFDTGANGTFFCCKPELRGVRDERRMLPRHRLLQGSLD